MDVGNKRNGTLFAVMAGNNVSRQARSAIHSRLLVSMHLYGRKVGYNKSKIKVEQMQWRCDLCVVCVEYFPKTDIRSDVKETCRLKKREVHGVENGNGVGRAIRFERQKGHRQRRGEALSVWKERAIWK
ncbi:hypothetical protein EVAR_65293_1 [Eumeta japonica]|uniref:Uncharacterized protein n=1 Tax=Eumeta variegata TaxID=151549 RepID=A0A4C1ZN24_EUMVA|nr:hypothetical protein EVAR_65293_1 [Eumeta japonica]